MCLSPDLLDDLIQNNLLTPQTLILSERTKAQKDRQKQDTDGCGVCRVVMYVVCCGSVVFVL